MDFLGICLIYFFGALNFILENIQFVGYALLGLWAVKVVTRIIARTWREEMARR